MFCENQILLNSYCKCRSFNSHCLAIENIVILIIIIADVVDIANIAVIK